MQPKNKIVELRESLGLTQQEFADKAGISRVTVSKFENDTPLTKSGRNKLIKVFQLPEDYFDKQVVKSKAPILVNPNDLKKRLDAVTRFSPSDQQVVIALIDSIREKMDLQMRLEKIQEFSGTRNQQS